VNNGANTRMFSQLYRPDRMALHIAAEAGYADVVRALAELDPTGVDSYSYHPDGAYKTHDKSKTALHFAVQAKHYDVVATLLDNNADINAYTLLNVWQAPIDDMTSTEVTTGLLQNSLQIKLQQPNVTAKRNTKITRNRVKPSFLGVFGGVIGFR
jgi:hypothetical protein